MTIVVFVTMILIMMGFLGKTLVARDNKLDKIDIVFDYAAGVKEGTKVTASGMTIGTVTSMNLLPDGKVKMSVSLESPIVLYQDYKIYIEHGSPLGGRRIDVEIGSSEKGMIPVSELRKNPLKGSYIPPIYEGDFLQETLNTFSRMANKVTGDNTIQLFIKKREVYDNFHSAYKDFRDIEKQFRKKGRWGRRLGRVYSRVQKIADRVSQPNDLDIFNRKKLWTQFDPIVEGAKKIRKNISKISDRLDQAEGSLGKMMNSEEFSYELKHLRKDFKDLKKGIDKTIFHFQKGKGTLAILFNNEEFEDDLKNTLTNIKIISDRIKRNEGTIGKLMTDKLLLAQIKALTGGLSNILSGVNDGDVMASFMGQIISRGGFAIESKGLFGN